jgi:hypothetical protein
MTRRAVLGTAGLAGVSAMTVAGCTAAGGGSAASPTPSPSPPDPETVLVASVIVNKEQLIARYQRTGAADTRLTSALEAFVRRHQAHVAALRRFLPPGAVIETASAAGPSAQASAQASALPSPPDDAPTLRALRDDERRAAEARPRQIAAVSPALAQLLASIGAWEAVHTLALGRLAA